MLSLGPVLMIIFTNSLKEWTEGSQKQGGLLNDVCLFRGL